MATVNDVIKIAQDEIGTKENPPSSNNVKYNTWYYGRSVAGAVYPWCACFVSWCFAKCDASLVKKTASCIDMGQWFKDHGQWHTTPQVGDVVFFHFNTNPRWTNHVGIVEKVNPDGSIDTIEGNTSLTNDDNGGAVMRRRRTSWVGFGRPNYSSINYLKAIDVSSIQSPIDYAAVAASGIKFAVLRGTKKSSKVDEAFETHFKGFSSVGIDCSVYKYSYATTEAQAIEEATQIIRLLGNRKIKIWLDLEDGEQLASINKEGVRKIAKAFIKTCKTAGFDVGIYCNLSWYNTILDAELKKYDLWIARYGSGTVTSFEGIENQYRPNVGEVAWQFTSKLHVPGINGCVDGDVLYANSSPTPKHETLVDKVMKVVKSHNLEDYKYLYIVDADTLNVRSTPTTKEENKINIYNKGQIVQVTHKTTDDGWFKTTEGYCSAKNEYIHQATATVTADSLNVRKGAGINYEICDQLTSGATVRCVCKQGEWVEIKTSDGLSGWCNSRWLTIA